MSLRMKLNIKLLAWPTQREQKQEAAVEYKINAKGVNKIPSPQIGDDVRHCVICLEHVVPSDLFLLQIGLVARSNFLSIEEKCKVVERVWGRVDANRLAELAGNLSWARIEVKVCMDCYMGVTDDLSEKVMVEEDEKSGEGGTETKKGYDKAGNVNNKSDSNNGGCKCGKPKEKNLGFLSRLKMQKSSCGFKERKRKFWTPNPASLRPTHAKIHHNLHSKIHDSIDQKKLHNTDFEQIGVNEESMNHPTLTNGQRNTKLPRNGFGKFRTNFLTNKARNMLAEARRKKNRKMQIPLVGFKSTSTVYKKVAKQIDRQLRAGMGNQAVISVRNYKSSSSTSLPVKNRTMRTGSSGRKARRSRFGSQRRLRLKPTELRNVTTRDLFSSLHEAKQLMKKYKDFSGQHQI